MGHEENEEAAGWVAEKLDALRALGYDELRRLESLPIHEEMRARSGAVLIRETVVYFDGVDGQDLRVMVDVWRPRRRRIIIGGLADDDFVIRPDGSFVAE